MVIIYGLNNIRLYVTSNSLETQQLRHIALGTKSAEEGCVRVESPSTQDIGPEQNDQAEKTPKKC